MLNKFNTVKLLFMGIVRSAIKYFLITIMFIFFMSSVIQTGTYIQLKIKGEFQIDDTTNINVISGNKNHTVRRVAGKVYLSSFGTVKQEQGWNVHYSEGAWSEIGTGSHNVEEMEEGSYSCSASEFFKNGCLKRRNN